MDFIGLLRSMQPEMLGAMGFLIFITIVFVLYRKFSLSMRIGGLQDLSYYWYWSRFWYLALVVLTVGCLLWRGLALVVANRMPRSDVTNGSGVFDQMKQNEQRGR